MPGAVSVEPDASTVQVACGQLTVNEATGATLGSASWSGASTTVHMVALRLESALVAVTPADWPVATELGAPLASQASSDSFHLRL